MKDLISNELLTRTDTTFSRIYPDYRKFFKYLGIGVIATVADWALFFSLINYTTIFYLYALAGSYFVGMIISFFLNKHYTFKNTYEKVHFQFASFAIVAIIGLGLNEGLLYGLIHYVFASDSETYLMISRVIVTFIVFIWNFILNKSVTFKVFQ